MKYKHLATVAAITALAACDSNEWTGVTSPATDAVQGNEAPILFQSGSSAQTRANITGKDAADLLGNKFRVYGVKTSGNSKTVPFDNYVVEYEGENSAKNDPEASNQCGWEYMGKTSLGNTSVLQGVVYWDLSADSYDFVAFSGLADEVKIDNTTENIFYVDAENMDKIYASDKVTATKGESSTGNTLNNKFREPVTLNFARLTARARIAFYETVPGYAVKGLRFYYEGNATAEAGTSDQEVAGLQGNFPTKGTYKITYDGNNQMLVNINSDGQYKGSFEFGKLDYTTAKSSATSGSSYLKEDGTIDANGDKVFLGTTATEATYAKVEGKDWHSILPNVDNTTSMKLRIDFTLVPLDGSQSTIFVRGAHVTLPVQYCQWKPNYAYTYLFRITDKTNGSTDPDPDPENPDNPDNPGLYAITFDAVVEDLEDFKEDIYSNVEGKEDGSNEEHDTPDQP